MARIAFAWEMGGEYGHISRLLTIASAFRARGHEICFILKDLSRAEAMLGAIGAPCYQAPHWVPTISGLPDAVNAGETLIRFGYLEASGLTGICRAWRNLYELLQPDLLFCDFAPTALLAARGTGIPTAVSDTGYGIPPAHAPLPPYRWWLERGPAPLEGAEARVLACINDVCAALGNPPYEAVWQVFRGDANFLCTFAELDHYPEREETRYWGPIANLEHGETPRWPQGSGPRVFLYLRPDSAGLAAVCRALVAAKARVLAFVPGLEGKVRDALKSRRLSFVDKPLRMDVVRNQCDAAICHAGLGTTAALLAAGRPLLMLPSQTEQAMIAMRVQRLGAGLVADARRVEANAPALIRGLLTDEGLREQARAFAASYRNIGQDDVVQAIVAACEGMLGNSAPGANPSASHR